VVISLCKTARQLPLFYQFLTANGLLSLTIIPLEKNSLASAINMFALNDKLECFSLAIHFSTDFVDKMKIVFMNEPLSKNLDGGAISL
jgi:hypothetical protein